MSDQKGSGLISSILSRRRTYGLGLRRIPRSLRESKVSAPAAE
jgi:hypothetical protein